MKGMLKDSDHFAAQITYFNENGETEISMEWEQVK